MCCPSTGPVARPKAYRVFVRWTMSTTRAARAVSTSDHQPDQGGPSQPCAPGGQRVQRNGGARWVGFGVRVVHRAESSGVRHAASPMRFQSASHNAAGLVTVASECPGPATAAAGVGKPDTVAEGPAQSRTSTRRATRSATRDWEAMGVDRGMKLRHDSGEIKLHTGFNNCGGAPCHSTSFSLAAPAT